MRIDVRGQHIMFDNALRTFVEQRLQRVLEKFERRIKRVAVYLRDVNGPRGGVDKQIRVVVHLRPSGHIIVNGLNDNHYAAVAQAVRRLELAVPRELQRRQSVRLRGARTENRATPMTELAEPTR